MFFSLCSATDACPFLRLFPRHAFVIDTAAEIIGYSRGMVLSHIQQKHIDAVRISGKYIISKAAIVDFLVSDIAFGIVNKSAWHMNTILQFTKK